MSSTIQITDAGVALMQAAQSPIVLTSYKLGTAYGYTPTAGQTALQGSIVYTGTPGAPVVRDANTVLYPSQIPSNVGPFTFGEIGYYYNATLFAVLVLDAPMTKAPLDPQANTGGPIIVDAFVPMVGSNYQMWANISEANTNKASVVAGPEGLPYSVNAIPNLYVVSGSGGHEAYLAYTDRQGLWNFDSYTIAAQTTLTGSSSTSLWVTVTAYGDLTFDGAGSMLVQITSGTDAAVVRTVAAAIPDNSGNMVLSFSAPLAKQPSVGDSVNIYVPNTGAGGQGQQVDLSSPPVIGNATPNAAHFTTLSITSALSANGGPGSVGQVLTSQGGGQPAQWTTIAAADHTHIVDARQQFGAVVDGSSSTGTNNAAVMTSGLATIAHGLSLTDVFIQADAGLDINVATKVTNPYGVHMGPGRLIQTGTFNGYPGRVQLNSDADWRSHVLGAEYLYAFQNKLQLRTTSTIRFCGDSTTAGDAIVNSYNTIDQLVQQVIGDHGFATSVVNAGHSGITTEQWRTTYLSGDLSSNPDMMVIRYGINEPGWLKSGSAGTLNAYESEFATRNDITNFTNSLRTALTTIRAAKNVSQLSIILMVPNSTSDSPNGRDEKWYEQVSRVVRQAARDFQCAFIDTYALWRDSRTAAGLWMDNAALPSPDGRAIHPLDIMNQWIASVIGDMVVPSGMELRNVVSTRTLPTVNQVPSQYPVGYSTWRVNTWTINSVAYNGMVIVFRGADGVVFQMVVDYTTQRQVAQRVGVTGADTWQSWIPTTSSSSPTTTQGDLIVRGASADQRLPIGAATYVLTSDGTTAGWQPSLAAFPDLSERIAAAQKTLRRTVNAYRPEPSSTQRALAYTNYEGARKTNTDGGLTVWEPDASNFYGKAWTRDQAMAMENFLEYFTAAEIQAVATYWLSKCNLGTGEVPDHIGQDGTVYWKPGSSSDVGARAPIDGNFFLIQMFWLAYVAGGQASAYLTNRVNLKTLLEAGVVYDGTTGLVNISDGAPYVGFGFFDSCVITGNVLFPSILAVRAFQMAAEMEFVGGNFSEANRLLNRADVIKAGIQSTMIHRRAATGAETGTPYYAREFAYGYLGTIKGANQIDLWSTAYAVYCDIVSPQDARAIGNYLHYTLYKDSNNYLNGGLRSIDKATDYNPGVQCYQAQFISIAYGSYQNGGFWPTPMPWVAYAVSLVDAGKARRFYVDMHAYSLAQGSNSFNEWWNASGVGGANKYLTSIGALLVAQISGEGPVLVADEWPGLVRTVNNETLTLLAYAPFSGMITQTQTKCASGTATVAFAINGTPLGGTANSASSSLQAQPQLTANKFNAGDVITMTVSANASCVDLSFVINYLRAA